MMQTRLQTSPYKRIVALGVGSILALSPVIALGKTNTTADPHTPTQHATTHTKSSTSTKKHANTQTNTHTKTKTTTTAPKTHSGTVSPSETTNKAGATAQCNDGLYSHSTTHEGSCSGHGGVKQFLK